MAPLSSVEQTQTPAKRWVLESQGVARGRAQLVRGSSVEATGAAPTSAVPADSPSLPISAGSEWKSVEVTPGGKMGILQ